MQQPKSFNIKCPRVKITMYQVDVVARFLRDQPKYDHRLRGEGRYSTHPNMHYLWKEENQATDWKDFNTAWGSPKEPIYIKTDRKHLVLPGEPFLVDAVGGELWICYENSAGKLLKVAPVSTNMQKDYGNSFNGYALLPEVFYESAT